ncbi:tetratricopeptide repeat protein [uncultured Maritalea sp.]|jgi:tetratricopeptide (TPR) repeat protein|uniref:tetratricopeptide repeat protein n=1 Tax=uncultured Maritalea sp. TaxID=757249 RepID=UPI00261264D8|nr:tetratricopeptide repeat protein [uncultured Maritalea sp.]
MKLIPAIVGLSISAIGANGFVAAQEMSDTTSFMVTPPSVSGSFLAGRGAYEDRRNKVAAAYFENALDMDWDNVVLQERTFKALLASGQVAKAETVARRLIEAAPNYEISKLVLGVVALKERRYKSVETSLSGASLNTLYGITSNVVLAWNHVGNGEKAKAYKTIGSITQDGFRTFLVFQHALMADVSGDKEKARALYEQAYEVDPYVFSIVEAYARFLANNGEFDQSLEVINRLLERGVTNEEIEQLALVVAAKKRPGRFTENAQEGTAELLRGLSSALSREGASEPSLMLVRLAGYINPKSVQIAFATADFLETAERYEEANAIYENIPKNSLHYYSALVRSAENLRALDQSEAAIKRLRNIVALRPDDVTAITALGDTLRFEKRYEEAGEAYSRVLKLTGGERLVDWHIYYVRGIAYERQKRWELAEADFKQALELYPDQPQVLNYLGYSWVDQGINLVEALEMIETAVSLRPNDGYIVDSLGWAYFQLGRYDDAVETLERANRLTPSDATINDHLGDAYWHVGRKREAGFQWAKAKEMKPDEELALKLDAKIADGLNADAEQADAG